MFYETRVYKKSYRVFSCVISTIIKDCVCVDYLACQSKTLIEINVGSGEDSKHGDKSLTEYWAL